jgi:hypothetical protein
MRDVINSGIAILILLAAVIVTMALYFKQTVQATTVLPQMAR